MHLRAGAGLEEKGIKGSYREQGLEAEDEAGGVCHRDCEIRAAGSAGGPTVGSCG